MRRSGFALAGHALDSPAALDKFLQEYGTTASLILQRGRLSDERYFNGATRDSLFKSFSMSRSVLSALIGIA
jgi:CubicO group peptidase (beta-lactamase class C family)